MPQGIGIRYSRDGIRILKVEMTGDGGFRIVGLTAGKNEGRLDEFSGTQGIELGEAPCAIGLAPGDFIGASFQREEEMDDSEMDEQLGWEIERKLISPPSAYIFDRVMVNDTGFIFAGRANLLDGVLGSGIGYFVDVEPVALYNGCERCGETTGGSVILTSVEAEGITTVAVENGVPVAMESFPIHVEEIAGVLPILDRKGIETIDDSIIERLVEHVYDSVVRLTGRAEGSGRVSPERLVVAGGGAYIGNIVEKIGSKTGLTAVLSDPFASASNDMREVHEELSGMGAAFTTCFGLALRAMEV